MGGWLVCVGGRETRMLLGDGGNGSVQGGRGVKREKEKKSKVEKGKGGLLSKGSTNT